MFRYRERMLSVVTRWNVLPRLHNQSVAEHSFYVALYTDQLTRILKWNDHLRAVALSFALRHDMTEVITGDIMGPIKRIAAHKKNLQLLEDDIHKELGPYYEDMAPHYSVRLVVKAANCIDEFFWLAQEVSMGNRAVIEMYHIVRQRMRKALRNINLETQLIDILDKESRDMNVGLGFPQNDSDMESSGEETENG